MLKLIESLDECYNGIETVKVAFNEFKTVVDNIPSLTNKFSSSKKNLHNFLVKFYNDLEKINTDIQQSKNRLLEYKL